MGRGGGYNPGYGGGAPNVGPSPGGGGGYPPAGRGAYGGSGGGAPGGGGYGGNRGGDYGGRGGEGYGGGGRGGAPSTGAEYGGQRTQRPVEEFKEASPGTLSQSRGWHGRRQLGLVCQGWVVALLDGWVCRQGKMSASHCSIRSNVSFRRLFYYLMCREVSFRCCYRTFM